MNLDNVGNVFIVNSVADFYSMVADKLLNAPKVFPRGKETRELICPQIIIKNPRERLAFSKGRGFNIHHALVESILLFSNSNLVEHISMFNKNMRQFSDDGETMNGSYGNRIAPYINSILAKLSKDQESRQAVLSIFNSNDMFIETKDVPCTETLSFTVRDGKLNLTVKMRSNDVLFGFQYDVFMFTMLQELVANTLGYELGYYIHQPTSLHVYKEAFGKDGYSLLTDLANSSTITVYNNSNVYEWKRLSEWLTQPKGYMPNLNPKSIASEVKDAIGEEIYRRNISPKKKRKKYNAPEWIAPFLDDRV